ncbi:MAG TPA: helix-turn-helix transcriptional regulator [Streptosporangiaceae bacterium]
MRPHRAGRGRPHGPGPDGPGAESLLQMRRALGRQLASLRNRAGLSQWDLAPLTGYSRSTLSDAELGRHRLRREFWLRCDELLKADGRLVACYDRIETAATVMEQRSRGAARLARDHRPPLRAVPPAPDHDTTRASGRHSRIAMEACPHCRRPIAVLVVPSAPAGPSGPSGPA